MRIEIQPFADGFKFHVMDGETAIASSPVISHREAIEQSRRLMLGGVASVDDQSNWRPAKGNEAGPR